MRLLVLPAYKTEKKSLLGNANYVNISDPDFRTVMENPEIAAVSHLLRYCCLTSLMIAE